MIKSLYRISITGKNPRNFLRSLYKLHIQMLKIEYYNNCIIILVDTENYKRLKKIKTSYCLDVIGRKGVARWKFLFQKHFVFVLSLIMGYLILFGLSNVIFDVEIVHTKEEIRSLVKKELEKEGIAKLRWKVSFERQEEIVSNILTKYKDKLEWLEIENVGTKYIVKVEERKINQPKAEKSPQDIIAKKDGVILKIEASTGTVIKKKNDFVKKGDVIITGVIKNQDTIMELVPADGVVYAETWYKSMVEMPLQYNEKYLTGKEKTVLQISFLNHKYNLFDFSPFTNSEDEIQKIVSNPLIPFSIQKTVQKELKVIDEVYTREEATKKAIELASLKLQKRLSVNDEIIKEKTLKITEKESKIIVEVFFKVKEDITATQRIDDVRLGENTKEE